MPFLDKDKNKEYQRIWQRERRKHLTPEQKVKIALTKKMWRIKNREKYREQKRRYEKKFREKFPEIVRMRSTKRWLKWKKDNRGRYNSWRRMFYSKKNYGCFKEAHRLLIELKKEVKNETKTER